MVPILRSLLAVPAALFGIILAVPVILVGVPFAAVATLSRTMSRLLEPPFAPWEQLIEFDPTLGWRPKPNINTHHLVDDVFHMTTDSQGWRGKTSIAESEIVVFGDSFAWGYGIDDKDFFADLDPYLRMKAVGTIGYNMVQELLWMQRLSSQLKGKLVVWFIYFGNDLHENVVPHMYGYRMPFVREVNGSREWEIITSHISPVKWLYISTLRRDGRIYYEKLAEFCTTTFVSGRVYSACEFLIRKGRDICSGAGARFVVMTIPDTSQLGENGLKTLGSLSPDPKSFDPTFPDQRIREICAKLEVPFVALKEHLTVLDYKTRDCHWNQRGHRRVAEVLSLLYHGHTLATNRPDME